MKTLSILMASLSTRKNTMLPLLVKQLKEMDLIVQEYDILDSSIKVYSNSKVSIMVLEDAGEATSGYKRQQLLRCVNSKYICNVDDDDTVSPNYLPLLLEGCKTEADVVTFNLRFFRAGVPTETWHFGLHRNYRSYGLMCVNHLCVWKTDIAKMVAWDPCLGYGDDKLWFEPLFHSDIVRSQYHINDNLYQYHYSPSVTANQRKEVVNFSRNYFKRGIRCFKDYAGNIFVEVPNSFNKPGTVTVRDRYNNIVSGLELHTLIHYHTVK